LRAAASASAFLAAATAAAAACAWACRFFSSSAALALACATAKGEVEEDDDEETGLELLGATLGRSNFTVEEVSGSGSAREPDLEGVTLLVSDVGSKESP